MKREIKILIETEQRIEISRPGQAADDWCEACHERTIFLSPPAAASLAGVSSYALYRWLEAGRLHTLETASRDWLICRSSLDAHLRKLGLSSTALADFMQSRADEEILRAV